MDRIKELFKMLDTLWTLADREKIFREMYDILLKYHILSKDWYIIIRKNNIHNYTRNYYKIKDSYTKEEWDTMVAVLNWFIYYYLDKNK